MIASLVILAALQAPVPNGLTATYATPGRGAEGTIKVEVAANGDIRGQIGTSGSYVIRHAGRSYIVAPGPKGPLVEDFADVAAVAEEEMARSDPHMCEKSAGGAGTAKLVPRGTVTVAGRSGTAYAYSDQPGEAPAVVISNDPALAPLGTAMAIQFRLGTGMLGRCLAAQSVLAPIQALLETGAPLKLGQTQLEKVEFGPIDPARFLLPAAPASRETIRATLSPQFRVPVRAEPNKKRRLRVRRPQG